VTVPTRARRRGGACVVTPLLFGATTEPLVEQLADLPVVQISVDLDRMREHVREARILGALNPRRRIKGRGHAAALRARRSNRAAIAAANAGSSRFAPICIRSAGAISVPAVASAFVLQIGLDLVKRDGRSAARSSNPNARLHGPRREGTRESPEDLAPRRYRPRQSPRQTQVLERVSLRRPRTP
jgi:hypothetical protein